MGAIHSLLQQACDHERFRDSCRAMLTRRILASWNSNDLWSCYRSYKELELPDKVSYEEIVGILGLRDSQLFQLWEIFSIPTPIGDLVTKLEFFTALALFSGASLDDKMRFLLAIFDTSDRGILSLTDLLLLITTTLTMIGKTTGMPFKPKMVKATFIESLRNDTAIGRWYQTMPQDQKWTQKFIGLFELEDFFSPLYATYDDMPISAHPAALDPSKRRPSPKKVKKKVDLLLLKKMEPVVTECEPEPQEEVVAVEAQIPDIVEDANQEEFQEERWTPLCFMIDAVVPKSAAKYHKAIAGALGANMNRVEIHHFAPPFMYFAVGGPTNKTDGRSCDQLAFIVHAQLQSHHSYLRATLPTAKLALNPIAENERSFTLAAANQLEERINSLEHALTAQKQANASKEDMLTTLNQRLAVHERARAVPPIHLPPPAFPDPIVETPSTFGGGIKDDRNFRTLDDDPRRVPTQMPFRITSSTPPMSTPALYLPSPGFPAKKTPSDRSVEGSWAGTTPSVRSLRVYDSNTSYGEQYAIDEAISDILTAL
eukprot:GEMP01025617.1.p1 GENE.GEMP01025617.1~~GEMP01025617.1.p1  ORF type:complete len:542 (+),score=118.89 GEMP01025617.1:50-1675(+)